MLDANSTRLMTQYEGLWNWIFRQPNEHAQKLIMLRVSSYREWIQHACRKCDCSKFTCKFTGWGGRVATSKDLPPVSFVEHLSSSFPPFSTHAIWHCCFQHLMQASALCAHDHENWCETRTAHSPLYWLSWKGRHTIAIQLTRPSPKTCDVLFLVLWGHFFFFFFCVPP